MGAMKPCPRYNVVSLRVSDDEMEALCKLTKKSKKSISEIMREALFSSAQDFQTEACSRK